MDKKGKYSRLQKVGTSKQNELHNCVQGCIYAVGCGLKQMNKKCIKSENKSKCLSKNMVQCESSKSEKILKCTNNCVKKIYT